MPKYLPRLRRGITLKKKGTSAERLFAFPSFQDKLTDFLIFKSKTHIFQPPKKALVLSDFLTFQYFKILVQILIPTLFQFFKCVKQIKLRVR